MNRILQFCPATRRWLLSSDHRDRWGWTTLAKVDSAKLIGVIKPNDVTIYLKKCPQELPLTTASSKKWGWFSLNTVKSLTPPSRLLTLLEPQLDNLARFGIPISDLTFITPPDHPVHLLFTQNWIQVGTLLETAIWYKTMRVGGAMVNRQGKLYDVLINKEWRHKGIASALLDHLLANENPPTQLNARPNIFNRGLELADLIKFYEKYGFKLIDPTTNFMVRE